MLLNQQFEQQKILEERRIQEKLRKLKEDRRHLSLEEIRDHEAAVDRQRALRNERHMADAQLSRIERVHGARSGCNRVV